MSCLSEINSAHNRLCTTIALSSSPWNDWRGRREPELYLPTNNDAGNRTSSFLRIWQQNFARWNRKVSRIWKLQSFGYRPATAFVSFSPSSRLLISCPW